MRYDINVIPDRFCKAEYLIWNPFLIAVTRLEKLFFSFIFIFSLLGFLAHVWQVGDAVWGDGRYYFAYTRSWVIDGDWQFTNEAEVLGLSLRHPETGVYVNKFSIGPALLWLPGYLVIHGTLLGLQWFGFSAQTTGYELPYQLMVGVASIGYGIAGLYVVYQLLKRVVSSTLALASVFGIWGATHLFFYIAVDPINSHAVSFFMASLVVWYWLLWQKQPSWKLALLSGVWVGCLGLMRSQDLIFSIGGLIWAWQYRKQPAQCMVGLVSYSVGVFLGFLPQLIAWFVQWSSLHNPYLTLGETFLWSQPQIGAAWFSAKRGLFIYAPLLLMSLWGWWRARHQKFLIIYAGITFFLQSYLVASWHSWWGGEAYGQRMFISLMPFFAIGLAYTFQSIKPKNFFFSWQAITTLALILNWGMIIAYLLSI